MACLKPFRTGASYSNHPLTVYSTPNESRMQNYKEDLEKLVFEKRELRIDRKSFILEILTNL